MTQPPEPPHYPQQVIVVKGPPTSGMAVASLVFGILGAAGGWCVFGIPCFIAILLGHGARADTKDGHKSGDGMAVAGLVLGYVFGVPWLFVGLAGAIGGLSN